MARKMGGPAGDSGLVTTIEKRAPQGGQASALSGIEELRRETAPLALEKSHVLCSHAIDRGRSMYGRNCRWFHGAWQYMLLLGLAASPERNLKFYLEAIRGIASGHGSRRILIAGCSDYTMLAIVLQAYDGLTAAPDITIIDRCDTPLYLCRWFADRRGCDIATEQCDILAYQPKAPFDLICTDGLISNFRPEARAGLVEAWHRLLVPGGFVVTTNNIHTGPAPKAPQMPLDRVAALCAKAVERKAALSAGLDLSDDALRRLVRDFASHPRTRSVRSTKEFKALFRPDQFRFERLDLAEIGGIAIKNASDTGKIGKTLNARVVAARL